MIPITDHYQRAYDHLLIQYRDKPRFAALLASYIRQIQDLEDATWQVVEARFIDNADLTRLKVLGRIVGQVYRGEDVEKYRTYVRARVKVNRSNGQATDLVELAMLLLGSLALSLEEYTPAAVVLRVNDNIGTLDARLIAELLREAKGAGVGFAFIFQPFDDTAFTFAASTTATEDAVHGWSSSVTPATGGQMVGVI